MKNTFLTVKDYIDSFPTEVQLILMQIRERIMENAPDAMEHISYGMPAYKTNGEPLVYFAAFQRHIGFYATPSGHAQFAEKLSRYRRGKGSVQFPISHPIPYDLIAEIVRFRANENKIRKKGQ